MIKQLGYMSYAVIIPGDVSDYDCISALTCLRADADEIAAQLGPETKVVKIQPMRIQDLEILDG